MKTIDRFMLKSYLGPMVLTFFIVMFVLMMNFLWRYIDELVGKGLDAGVISELIMYACINLIPMGLPLATLLGAIMTMGNMGENYELLAMKSSGMSLPRIMRPLIIVIALISVGSFFIANNLVPYANRQMLVLLYDIRQQKQSIEFKDGLFFNGIPDISIRVGSQNPETKLLKDVLIYDNRNTGGNMTTSIADSGYISLSDDKRFLVVTLFNGETFEHTRGTKWYDANLLSRNYFTEQSMMIHTSGFEFARSDANMFSRESQSKNLVELGEGVDSLQQQLDRSMLESYQPFLQSLFIYDQSLAVDSLYGTKTYSREINTIDSIAKMGLKEKQKLWDNTLRDIRNSRYTFTYEESAVKETLTQLYRFQVDWHGKLSLPVSIMIFFLIGAPLGAIIRKGGLGMPIVISVVFFVFYYIINLTGQKLAKEGSWDALSGTWLSTFVLFPLAVFLVYKATNDSNLFNAEWYIMHYKTIKEYILKKIEIIKERHNGKRQDKA